MAYIKQRARSDGTFSHTVMWRGPEDQDGKRKQESEVFDDETAAERFKDLVNGHGQDWPPGWVRGRGFVRDVREPGELFEPFALNYIDQLTGVQGDTKAEYRKLVHQKLSPWFRSYSIREGEGGLTSDHIRTWVNDLEAGRPAPHDPKDARRRRKLSPQDHPQRPRPSFRHMPERGGADAAPANEEPLRRHPASPQGRRGRKAPPSRGSRGEREEPRGSPRKDSQWPAV